MQTELVRNVTREHGAGSSEAPALPQSHGALLRHRSCAHRDDLIPLTVGLYEVHGKADGGKVLNGISRNPNTSLMFFPSVPAWYFLFVVGFFLSPQRQRLKTRPRTV